MPLCECGCGGETAAGQFLSGHDQKLRTALERKVGGLLGLRTLVSSAAEYSRGETSAEAFTKEVRGVFSRTQEV